MRRYADAIEQHRPGVLDDVDPEHLHELRIAIRRTRALINRFRDTLPDCDGHAQELRWLGQRTGELRDLDVFLARHDAYASWVDPERRADLEPLRDYLRRRRAGVLRETATALTSARYRRMMKQWRAYLDAAAPTEESIGALAATQIRRTLRAVRREGRAITDASPPEELHELRKTCKKLRYLLEAVAELDGSGGAGALVGELKPLLQVLGDFQDLEVHATALTAMAAELGAPATVLAMGELRARMDDHRDAARRGFARAFQRFDRPKNRAAARGLFATAAGTSRRRS